jgi:transcriptional regulator with XRE-family HTH domain
VTWLRNGRAVAALTYEQLASRTEYSADTLARAASGRSVPQNPAVVLAYAAACGRSTKEAERLWKHARRDEARTQGVISGHRSGVHISVVKDFADLHSALVDLHHDDGRPPLRSLDARLGGVGRLPHSTVGRVLKGSSTPSRTFVAAFSEACNVRRSELPEWTKAWDRADADRRSSRLRSRKPDTAQRLIFHDRVTPRDLQLLMSEMESTSRKTPALKLTVHVPDPASLEADAAARMSRELLIDQAQRRGELACPQCRRPSFGYNDERGWAPQLCSSCAPDAPHEGDLSASGADAPALERFSPVAGPAPDSAVDTPTLFLRGPAPSVRPPLPRRKSTRLWSPPATGLSAPALNPDPTRTSNEPASPQPFIPSDVMPLTRPRPTPAPLPALRAPGGDCPEHGEESTSAGQQQDNQPPPAPPPTLRIRINIPGSRPFPPVVMRPPGEPVAGQSQPSTPKNAAADGQVHPEAEHPAHHSRGSVELPPRGHPTDGSPPPS